MASPNTLTNLIPVIYEAQDVVAAEKTGFIGAVTLDANADSAALNQSITSFQTRAVTTTNITPGSTPPDTGGQVLDPVTLTISKSKMVPIQWTGDEQLSVRGQVNNMLRDQIVQAYRAIRNEVEADLAGAAIAGASRAFGTPGTAPFGTANNLQDFAAMARILDDNGAPDGDRTLVVDSAAMANLRGQQAVLFRANEAGTDALLRQGVVGQVQGLNVKNSRFVAPKGAVGTLSAGTVTAAAGATALTLTGGTGTILAGDVVTIAGNKYVVTTALSGGNFSIAAPGLVAAVSSAPVTMNATFTGNAAFHKSAILLAARQPAMPQGGDGADDVMAVTDPYTGMTYQFALYRGYRQIRIEVGLAWGWRAMKPEYIALLQG